MSEDRKKPLPDDVFEIESLNVDHLDVEELERRIELTVGLPMIPGDLGIWCDCDGQCNHCVQLCSTHTCTTHCSDCPSLCSGYCSVLNCLDSCTVDEIQI